MRKKRAVRIANVLLPLLGCTAILVAVFSFQLGLDNNPVMGSGRKTLAAFGALLTLICPAWILINRLSHRLGLIAIWTGFRTRLANSRLAAWLDACGQNRLALFTRAHSWIWIVISILLVVLVSVWHLTAGTFSRWTPYTRYFDRQADAFLAGQFALLDEPPAELAALGNDLFDWRAREGIDYLWDVSYYQGRYYLYWGPAPALAAAAIKLIHPGVVEDQVLVLIFITGLAAALGFVFHRLRRDYFPSAPDWTILLFTLTGVFCLPVFWLVNRPSVYEAAIACAQFFLLLGLYGALRGITPQRIKIGWLALAGAGFGLAVASRTSYAVTIILVSLGIIAVLLKDFRSRGWRIDPLLSFSLPLVLAAAGLAWFNFARFGNIFETGLKYQLTGDALPVDRSLLFSLDYFLPNAYSSLFRPLARTPGLFPFFSTPYILDHMWPNFIHRPATYYSSEQVAGVLVTIPFLWLLALPVVGWVRTGLDWINEKPRPPVETSLPVWIPRLIALAVVVQLFTSLMFVMTTMRYLADFTTLLILSTGLVVFTAYTRLGARAGWRRALSAVVVLLCMVSIVIGLLTNMQGADKRFENNNPRLYGQMIDFFDGQP
ncbi:MAG: hypothetical protein AB9891_01460 [Anaerolineaceae bacterium]